MVSIFVWKFVDVKPSGFETQKNMSRGNGKSSIYQESNLVFFLVGSILALGGVWNKYTNPIHRIRKRFFLWQAPRFPKILGLEVPTRTTNLLKDLSVPQKWIVSTQLGHYQDPTKNAP